MQVYKFIAIILLFQGPFSLLALDDVASLVECEKGVVDDVLPMDRLKLQSGKIVQLMMVQSPRMPIGTQTGRPWPLATQINSQMKSLLKGHALTLYCKEPFYNRHDELVAMAMLDEREWLQETMISRGWARVYSQPDYRFNVRELYAREAKAKEMKIGLWSYDSYAIRQVDELNNKMGRFEVIEATVRDVAEVNNITYLNFGQDWRKDFTLQVDWRAKRLFDKAGIGIDGFKGKHIQVRGWLSWRGGPMIQLTHPEQIQQVTD